MSVHNDNGETVWAERQEALKRVRSQISSHGSARNSHRNTPASQVRYSPADDRVNVRSKKVLKSSQQRQPLTTASDLAPSNRTSHGPYGKYRRSSSPFVERIETPPEHETYQNKENIRRKKYDVVPPVKKSKRKPVSIRTPEYDSWGEEEESDEEEQEHRYPQPAMSYPYPFTYGAPLMYGGPVGMFYPPPPQPVKPRKNVKKKSLPKKEKPPRKINVTRKPRQAYDSSDEDFSPPKEKERRTRIPEPVHRREVRQPPEKVERADYQPSSLRKEYYEDEKKDIMRKYKYIYPRDQDTPYLQNSKMYHHFLDSKLFADDLVDRLIGEFLETEIIPDLLIESMSSLTTVTSGDPIYIPSAQVSELLIDDVVDEMLRKIVRSHLNDMVDVYIYDSKVKYDPMEYFLGKLVDDTVRLMTREIVQDATMELAVDWMEIERCTDVATLIITDYVRNIAPDIIEDAVEEVYFEQFIEDEVVRIVTEEESNDIVREVVEHYDNKIVQRELKEVTKHAKDRLVDSFSLDYLLLLMSRQGKLFTQHEIADKFLDSMVMDILLSQYERVIKSRDLTVKNHPLKRLHERIANDVGLDVLLQHAVESLDEDLGDIDEYERGVDGILASVTPSAMTPDIT